ncbi:HNH endonuclease signature motif containing protein [Pseudoblastomonas flavescens]|uniref:HNH endonuclease signature motif containing protein n=1 Tax=Alteriqipengyuania flavescens TaxID=3053610 RepID=UPI00384D1620
MAEWPYSTAQWQRLRKVKLSASPLCEDCRAIGRHIQASHVDHVHAISDGGPPFPGLDGLRALCLSCHSAKTARGPEAGAARTTKPRKGCDAKGTPLAPNHPWNGGSINERVSDRPLLGRVRPDCLGITDSRHKLRFPRHDRNHRAVDPSRVGTTQTAGAQENEKSLVTGETRAPGDHKIELVSKGNRNGR